MGQAGLEIDSVILAGPGQEINRPGGVESITDYFRVHNFKI